MYRYKGTGNNGTFAWIMQRISGLVIAIFASVIFFQLSFGEGSHTLSSWLLMPVLMFGTWHTLSGFKMITDDYVACPIKRFLLLCLYWAMGIAMLGFGLSYAIMV